DLVPPRPPDVRDHEDRAEQPDQHEHQRDRALDAPLGERAADREARRIVDDLHAVPAGALADQVEPGHAGVVDVEVVLAPVERVVTHDFPAIQIVQKTSAAMPTRKMTIPSGTGP